MDQVLEEEIRKIIREEIRRAEKMRDEKEKRKDPSSPGKRIIELR